MNPPEIALVVAVALVTGALTASITNYLVTQRMEVQIVGHGCGTYTETGEFVWVPPAKQF